MGGRSERGVVYGDRGKRLEGKKFTWYSKRLNGWKINRKSVGRDDVQKYM